MNMTGVVDLAAMAAAREAQERAQAAAAKRAATPDATQVSNLPVVIDVTSESFEADVVLQSKTVPVVIDLWATWCEPCKQLSPILEALAHEYAGRWVLAKIDVDAQQQIAAAFQVQSIPAVFVAVAGQVAPLFQGAMPEVQVRQVIEAVLQQAASIGVTGLVAGSSPTASEVEQATEVVSDPRFDAAEAALEVGDWDAAEVAYKEVLAVAPADAIAQIGLLNVQLLKRTDGMDFDVVLGGSDDLSFENQLTVADAEFMCNEYASAFKRLTDLVRVSAGAERDAVRSRLLDYFSIVGPDDPAVVQGRLALSNALF
jgi:putative thioredoxin